MEEATMPRSGMPGEASDGGGPKPDWAAVQRSPEFQELIKQRRRFVIPATAFFLGWYLGFILLAGYAPDFMGESVYEGLTVGYVLAMSQFLMVWVLTWAYLKRAREVFDPLAEKAVARAKADAKAVSGR